MSSSALFLICLSLNCIAVGLDISDYVTARSNERPSQQRVQDMIKRSVVAWRPHKLKVKIDLFIIDGSVEML